MRSVSMTPFSRPLVRDIAHLGGSDDHYWSRTRRTSAKELTLGDRKDLFLVTRNQGFNEVQSGEWEGH